MQGKKKQENLINTAGEREKERGGEEAKRGGRRGWERRRNGREKERNRGGYIFTPIKENEE